MIFTPDLISPHLDKEFSCKNGFGTILEQVGDVNERHPASRAINDAEKKYPHTKLEMAAIVFAV